MKSLKIMVVLLLAGIVSFGVIGRAESAFVEVYSNDFDSGVGAEWSNQSQVHQQDANILTPYLGYFWGGQSTTLTLAGLQTHTQVELSYDLYLFNTWDGSSGTWGPDYISLSGNFVESYSWTFSNHVSDTYPGTADEIIDHGSAEYDTHVYRGLDPTGVGDTFLLTHTSSTFIATFAGPTTQADEMWGIDNVVVKIDSEPVPEPTTVALLGIGLAGLAGAEVRRRRKKRAVDKAK